MTLLKKIVESYSDMSIIKADGFDEAIIGIDDTSFRLIYSVSKCLDILEKEGMSDTEALEHFTYNVSGSHIGEKTPIWANDCF